MPRMLTWGNGCFELTLAWSDDSPPRWASRRVGDSSVELSSLLPITDVQLVGAGHLPASDRLVHSAVSHRLRYVGSSTTATPLTRTLRIEMELDGLRIVQQLEAPEGVAAFRTTTQVVNTGDSTQVIRALPTFQVPLGDAGSAVREWMLHSATSDWLGENRWRSDLLGEEFFPRIAAGLTGWAPRGELRRVSTGTWSTGRALPTAVLESERLGAAWGWQIEHNGAWRWEIGDEEQGAYFAVSGPTDDDHHWALPLRPGESFETVPAAIALGETSAEVFATLTRYRRATRRPHADNGAMPVIFNDYMNTLNGDPTTAKLLPLIDSAAAVGAEVFCIDAGWYDDGPWWDSVGEWMPAPGRFPGGLVEVLDHIRERGMIPGLWLEPEVVGVESPLAATLPDDAFLSRFGSRVVEHGRYHLDLAHPVAVAHLNGVIDRLVGELGVGYLKLDYNINPGSGTDRDAPSPGVGLLRHNRAHLRWLDDVLDRYPALILENCGSGGMRADGAMLSRLQLQSTSDQQDFMLYPPIAASAPASMLPEQAASWAYPQPGMTDEEVTFCLVTGLLGRFFLSGFLDNMESAALALVREAVSLAKHLRPTLVESTPWWPLGLPAWDAPWVALGLVTGDEVHLSVWNRDANQPTITFAPPSESSFEILFPAGADGWAIERTDAAEVILTNHTGAPSARLFHLTARDRSQK